jgi:pimeloyl-ACP methyl ester carboxylesterase
MVPETRYARSGDVHIAYQVAGAGPRDLVFVPGWVSNIEVFWEEPSAARFLERLMSFSRLILFDKRGTGLSDRSGELPDLETRMDDVRAVMDAAGCGRATLCGYSEGGPMCALFAATYPSRTSSVIMIGGYARLKRDAEYPEGRPLEAQEAWLETMERTWGGPVGIETRAPSVADDPAARSWWARFLRMSASPAAAVTLTRMNYEVDIRHVLPVIRVPTLVLHNAGDRTIGVQLGRALAKGIHGATYVELPGIDHLPWVGNPDAILDEIEEFVTGARHGPEPDRVLATILFTDIAGSTERAAALGDRRWRDLLATHHGAVRRELGRFRGREIDTAGDGFLAAFDGPARAVKCAVAIRDAVRQLGIEIRAGLHTGECEVLGEKLSGIAMHTGARVAAHAKPGEVVVSNTVKDLVAGSGIRFQDSGVHSLKGVPGEWHLYSVVTT